MRRRKLGGLDDWPVEHVYVDAARVLRLPDTGSLRLPGSIAHKFRSYCAFRRLFSDGNTLLRFELGVGFRRANPPTTSLDAAQFEKLCHTLLYQSVQIVAGGKPIVKMLGDAGSTLATAYLRASTKKTFSGPIDNTWVAALRPMLLFQYELETDISEFPKHSQSVAVNPFANVRLSHHWMAAGSTELSCWMLGVPKRLKGEDFCTARGLRLNLGRLHAEREALRHVLKFFASPNISPKPGSKSFKALEDYLRYSFRVFAKKIRYGLPQSEIFTAAFDAKEKLSGEDGALILNQLSAVRKTLKHTLKNFLEAEKSALSKITHDTASQSPTMKAKPKILFLSANPLTSDPLRLDAEVREIQAKLRSADYRHAFEFVQQGAVRPDDLMQSFNQHKPLIVHFSGHGSEDGKIQVENNLGAGKLLEISALTALFHVLKKNIRLVFLNSCYSEKQAHDLAKEIDCVIGMQDAVSDKAAIVFAANFYRALGFGESVKTAFDQGIVALKLEKIQGHKIPKLFVRAGINASTLILTTGN